MLSVKSVDTKFKQKSCFIESTVEGTSSIQFGSFSGSEDIFNSISAAAQELLNVEPLR
jgi:hypothetical protein